MYRTDKQFMKNPATASSRIYVGNLPENSKPEDLEGIFSQHGRILGLVVQKNFAFVQFESDEQAHAAIAMQHGFPFFGRNMNVKQAIDNNKKPPGMMIHPQHQAPMNLPPQQQQNRNMGGNMGNQQQFPPPNHQQQQQNIPVKNNPQQNQAMQYNMQPSNNFNKMQTQDDFHRMDHSGVNSTPNMNANMSQTASHNAGPGPKPAPVSKPPQNSPLVPAHYSMNKKNIEQPRFIPPTDLRGGLSSIPPSAAIRGKDFRDEYREELFYDNYGPSKGSGSGQKASNIPPANDSGYCAPLERPERNDCEIIVVSKGLTEYAEYIENRLKERDLIVDLLFPNDDVPIGRVLANISSRGCLYAILIMPQNEDHRSLTLNILHGIPEEHRNMPIEDAFLLISRNFSAYMRGEKTNADSKEKASRHPEHIQTLMNLLAENRQLSIVQYDKVLSYLKEKRELQQKFDIDEGIETGDKNAAEAKKQADLQNRIMSILNKKGDSQPATVEVSEKLKTKTDENPELLTDPSVQKALDSIMLGDMFKNIITQT